MATVDNRIVHMTFDNAQFERGIAQTMASMEKMKASLDFSKSKDAFADISRSASNINLGGMTSAIDHIAGKFTALGVTAFSVISNIANRVINAGLDMAKKFAIGPITDGFREMETNMNSIQTILANTDSKGSTLDDVNTALETLNEYSDQTIYNFSQMAKNIGTFTAAGVDLDTSVNSIKGIANLAAISGSSADQASNAMYQLSQALASGSVKLMDWNSIVNAGMGGEVFQKALFETGKSLGTIVDTPIDQTFDEWKDAGNTFRTSLEDGWLTADVLTNTLQSFTGDLNQAQLVALGYTEAQATEMMRLGALGKAAATEVKTLTQLLGTVKESVASGWSKSFQIIFGDFEEAKDLFTGINNAVGEFVKKQSDARNKLLQGWKDLGGRTLLIEALKDAFRGLATIVKPIKEAFQDMFPPVTANLLLDLTRKFALFTEKIAISGLTALRLKVIFKGIFAAFQIVMEVVKETAGLFKSLYQSLIPDDASGGVLNFFEDFAVKVINLKKVLVDGQGIAAFFETIEHYIRNPMDALEDFQDMFRNLASTIDGAFQEILNIFLRGDFTGVGPWAEDSKLVDSLFNFRELVVDVFTKISDFLSNVFGVDISIPTGITEFFKSFGENVGGSTSNSIDFAGGIDRISTALNFVWEAIKKVFDILTSLGEAIKWVWDQFDGFGAFLADMFGGIIDFASEIGPNLQKAFMSDEFGRFIDFLDSVGMLLGGAGIGKIAKDGLAVDLTGGSLSNLGELFKDLSSTIPGVKKNLNELTGVFSAMQTEIKADALMKIAAAIGIITLSVLVLSFIDPKKLASALSALAIGFGQLIGAMALLSKMGAGPKGAANITVLAGGMIALATASLILAGAVAVLATMSWEDLSRGLSAITTLLGLMVGTVALMNKAGGSSALIGVGLGMMAIGVALNFIAASALIFATMNPEELAQGLGSIAAVLGLIALAVKLMPAKITLIAPSLVAIGVALNLIAASMLIFSSMSLEEIGKGVLAIAGALLVIAFAMGKMPLTLPATAGSLILVGGALVLIAEAMKTFGSMNMKQIGKAMLVLGGSLLIIAVAMKAMTFALPGAIALGIVAVSLLLLARVLKEFGGMKLQELATGLVAIVAVLAILALSALALQPAIGAMLLLGVALTAIGAGFALFGVGAMLVAKALETIAVAGTAGINVLMYALDQLLIRLPEMLRTFAEGILGFLDVLLQAAPGLIESLSGVVQSIIQLLIDNVPKLVELGIDLIEGLLEGIREVVPDIVDTGLTIILSLLQGIEEHIDDIVAAGLGILVSFLEGITDNIDDVADAVGELITTFIEEVGELYGDIADAGTDAVIEFVQGMAENVIDIARNIGLMVSNIMSALATEFVKAADRGARIIIRFLNDLAGVIRKNDDRMGDAMANLGIAIIEGMIVGMTSAADRLYDAVLDIAEQALEEMTHFWEWNSPSHLTERLGKGIIEGMVLGLNEESSNLNKTALGVSEDAMTSLQKAVTRASIDMESMNEFNPTITPVLDLTNVKTTAGQLTNLLSGNVITGQVSLSQANAISTNATTATEDTETNNAPKEVKFEQNIYSPTTLNTATIYRQTRNQLELTKKELAIP